MLANMLLSLCSWSVAACYIQTPERWPIFNTISLFCLLPLNQFCPGPCFFQLTLESCGVSSAVPCTRHLFMSCACVSTSQRLCVHTRPVFLCCDAVLGLGIPRSVG